MAATHFLPLVVGPQVATRLLVVRMERRERVFVVGGGRGFP